MADLADGTYLIAPAISPGLALDVAGASDESGANVQIYTKNGGDAQKWNVNNYGTNGAQIACALSGRCLDIDSASITNGSNIRQWEDNNSDAQRWDIKKDGKAIKIDGKSYPTYVIRAHGKEYAVDISSGSLQSGSNIQLYQVNGTDAQRFVFIPIDVLTKGGTYKIVSALAQDLVLDVAGGSRANGANVALYTDNGTEAQRWIAQKNDDGTFTFLGAGSKKAIDDQAAGRKPGSNLQIYAPNYSQAQSFLVQRAGTMIIDGQTVPTYELEVQAGQNLYVDVASAEKRAGTNVQLYTGNHSVAQRFAFVPATSPVHGLPVPAGLTLDSLAANGKSAVQLTFRCNYAYYQARCRFRKRNAGGVMGVWSSWKSARDGLAGNEGWGDAWSATFRVSATSGDQKTAAVLIPKDYRVGGSVVAVDMQVEVRCHASHWDGVSGFSVHGDSASTTFHLAWKPKVTVESVQLTGSGLLIGYRSDLNDGGCTITVDAMGATEKVSGLYGGKGTVLIPAAKLTEIPSGKISCSATIAKEIASDPVTASISVEDSAGRKRLSIGQTTSEYGTHIISVPTASETDVIQVYVTSKGVPVESYEKSRKGQALIEAVSPLHSHVNANVWVTRSDGSWDAQALSLDPIKGHAFCWLYPGGACVLDLGKEDGPSQEDISSRGVEDYEVLGRAFHSYRLKDTKERSLAVSGAVVASMPEHGQRDAFEGLLSAGHAVFRNPRGEIIPVVVTGVSQPAEHDGWTEIKVTQYQEAR